MSLYGEQLKERKTADQYAVQKNERLLANSVSSVKSAVQEQSLSAEENLRQIELIAHYFQIAVPFYQPGEEALPELIDLR